MESSKPRSMPRRRMLPGEIAIPLNQTSFLEELAENLGIDGDGEVDGGTIVARAIKKTHQERIARSHERRARMLRGEEEGSSNES